MFDESLLEQQVEDTYVPDKVVFQILPYQGRSHDSDSHKDSKNEIYERLRSERIHHGDYDA